MTSCMNFNFGLLIFLSFTFSQCQLLPEQQSSKQDMKTIDFQGHRGARGLLPENTIPAFLIALSFPKVTTLELDVAVSKGDEIIISHEPFFSHHIASHPDGRPVTKEEEHSLNIYEMTLAQISTFDVGSRGNERFPQQTKMKISKPSLKAMVNAIKEYCEKNNRSMPNFDLEIKSQPDYYNVYTPQPKKFVQLVLEELKELEITSLTNLQSFDVQILEEIHLQKPSISTSLLVEHPKTFEAHLETISFKPTNYSPYFEFVTEDVIRQAKAKGIKVIPWTVNEMKDLQRMVDLGVDGIITDYPNRIEMLNLSKTKQ